jgi:iron complex transport system permease protein
MVLVLAASRRVSTMTLLILGLMIGYGTTALVSIMMHFSIAERIHQYINWTFGSFGGTTWQELRVFVPVIAAGLLLAHALIKPLDALLLGEAYAQSMGLPIKRSRALILFSTALLSGVVVAYCGPIGFIGVAVPHLCRALLHTANHRMLIPAATLTGALAALAADLIAQVPGSSTVLPLNAVTALIGAPIVIRVILQSRRTSEASD